MASLINLSMLGKYSQVSCQQEFDAADAHLRETLPPLVTAAFSIIPPLLSSLVLVQNRLLGLYYTALHNYCQDYDFPSPPPPMEDVIEAFTVDFEPAKAEIELIPCVAAGKTVRLGMRLPEDPSSHQSRPPSAIENGARRSSSALIGSGGAPVPPRPNRIPSAPTLAASPSPAQPPRPSFGSSYTIPSRDHLTPTDFTTASRLGQAAASSSSSLALSSGALRPPADPRADYFARRASTSTTASTNSAGAGAGAGIGSIATPLSSITNSNSNPNPNSAAAVSASASAALAAGVLAAKKKAPPPPPPPKRGVVARQPEEFVVAQYAFSGQGAGDLSFREGDRIRIVKRTATDQDWWVGELGGVRGNFPANYCRAA